MAKQLSVDFEDLRLALQDHSGEGSWFLNTETGEVVRLSDHDVLDEELAEEIEKGESFLAIPAQDSKAAYRDMRDFIAATEDHRLRGLLDGAFHGKGAFRRFKGVLREFPADRERWFAFEQQRIYDRIRRWLETEGIEAVPRALG